MIPFPEKLRLGAAYYSEHWPEDRWPEDIRLLREAGNNGMFLIEIGTWGADPVTYREEYGKDLLMMGGFILFCDHSVPPDVPDEN